MSRLRWTGTALQVVGVFALSGRALHPAVAFGIMLGGSLAWMLAGVRMRDGSIVALNAAFTASNVLGICRWLAP